MEIGDYLRTILRSEKLQSKKLVHKIIKKYENAIECGKQSEYHENCSLAYRALAEITLEGSKLNLEAFFFYFAVFNKYFELVA